MRQAPGQYLTEQQQNIDKHRLVLSSKCKPDDTQAALVDPAHGLLLDSLLIYVNALLHNRFLLH